MPRRVRRFWRGVANPTPRVTHADSLKQTTVSSSVAGREGALKMGVTEDQIAEQLAELEPAWVTRPNLFADLIARRDVPALLSRLNDAAPGARADAAEALGKLKEASATARLKQLTGDLDPNVRRAAAAALVALADEGMLKEFVKSLRDPSAKVVAGAAIALGEAGYKDAVPYLLKAYRTEHPRIAAAVAVALGRLGSVDAVPWLTAAVKTGLAPVEAAEALGRIGDPAAGRILVEQLGHSFAPLRAAAARALGMLALARTWDFVLRDKVIATLQRSILDPDERVKLCAGMALAQFGDPKAREVLKKFVEP